MDTFLNASLNCLFITPIVEVMKSSPEAILSSRTLACVLCAPVMVYIEFKREKERISKNLSFHKKERENRNI